MRLFVFACVFVFVKYVAILLVKVVLPTDRGVVKTAHRDVGSELRDLCEVEFWEVCFGGRYKRMFNVFRHATPHYQIVDLESISFSLFSF